MNKMNCHIKKRAKKRKEKKKYGRDNTVEKPGRK